MSTRRSSAGAGPDGAIDLVTLEDFAAEVDDPATVAVVVDAYLAQLPRRRAGGGEPRGPGDGGRDRPRARAVEHDARSPPACRVGGGAGARRPRRLARGRERRDRPARPGVR